MNKGADVKISLVATDTTFPRHWKSGSLKYDDFEPLAEGGAAIIRSCVDVNLRRTVAYKTMQPDLVDSDMETGRFLREARVTAQISHPGTVPVYELGRDSMGAMFFTMKKLAGRDLRAIMMDVVAMNAVVRGAFPLTRLVDILIQVSNTVGYAHAHGVIHRDLKPANILIGEFGEVTVLDWGLAKVWGDTLDEPEEASSAPLRISKELTQPGRRYGTPMYMSPEQASGRAEIDERTDVFNLGIILYEILTYKDFIWADEVADILDQILKRPVPQPREVAAERDIPLELEAVCLKCLSREPEGRYGSMKELASDLQAWRNGEELLVCPYGWFKRVVRWNQRHTLMATGLLCLVVGLVIGCLI